MTESKTTLSPEVEILLRELDEEFERGREEWKDSSTSPNSYGAGYDGGYCDGIKWAIHLLRGEQA